MKPTSTSTLYTVSSAYCPCQYPIGLTSTSDGPNHHVSVLPSPSRPPHDVLLSMGYPATGFAALYRNKRRDVLHFIDSRHGDKWWIWNLCVSLSLAHPLKASAEIIGRMRADARCMRMRIHQRSCTTESRDIRSRITILRHYRSCRWRSGR